MTSFLFEEVVITPGLRASAKAYVSSLNRVCEYFKDIKDRASKLIFNNGGVFTGSFNENRKMYYAIERDIADLVPKKDLVGNKHTFSYAFGSLITDRAASGGDLGYNEDDILRIIGNALELRGDQDVASSLYVEMMEEVVGNVDEFFSKKVDNHTALFNDFAKALARGKTKRDEMLERMRSFLVGDAKKIAEDLEEALTQIKSNKTLKTVYSSDFEKFLDLRRRVEDKHSIPHWLSTMIFTYANKGDKDMFFPETFKVKSLGQAFIENISRSFKDYEDGHEDDEFIERFLSMSSLDVISYIEDLKHIVKKEIEDRKEKLKNTAEEDPRAAMGRIAFGQHRKDGTPYEKDTEYEKKVYNAISDHVNGNITIPASKTKLINALLRKNLYPKIIAKPGQEEVYRGMTVTPTWLATAIGESKVEDLSSMGTKEKKFVFTPIRGDSTSWSVSEKKAQHFARFARFESKDHYAVLLYARVEDNPNKFLDLTKGIYDKVSGFEDYAHEKEVIGLGKINVYKIEWKRR